MTSDDDDNNRGRKNNDDAKLLLVGKHITKAVQIVVVNVVVNLEMIIVLTLRYIDFFLVLGWLYRLGRYAMT